ncbi:MAG: carboxymuconolactone decarboxylase [Saprospiraceae bacterium]
MSHIPLESHLPGITGLLEYRKDSAAPIRKLTQILLRGPSSLTEGERELIATIVSAGNECKFCTAAHRSASNILLGEESTCDLVIKDFETAPVSNKLKALLNIAVLTQKGGNKVTNSAILRAKENGASELEIHDTVLIAALFCLYNKYVDGLNTFTPKDEIFYNQLGERITTHGYNRLDKGYDHLKNNSIQ